MAQGDLIVGRGVRVEVSKTEGAPKTVTAVTLANPGVATSTAHTLLAKSVAFFRAVTGMVQLEGQAVRFGAVDTNTLTLTDINTESFPAFTGGQVVPITAWSTLAKATGWTEGGGDAEKLNATTMLDVIRQEVNGLLAAQTVSIPLLAESLSSEAMAIVKNAARTQGYLVFRCTWSNGDVVLFRGEPSLPGRDVQQGQLGTSTISVTVKGFVIEGAA
jgi:hypothetical protein